MMAHVRNRILRRPRPDLPPRKARRENEAMVPSLTPPTRSGRFILALAVGLVALAATAIAQEKGDKPPKRDIFAPAPKPLAVEPAVPATGELAKQLDKARAINDLLAKSWKDNN